MDPHLGAMLKEMRGEAAAVAVTVKAPDGYEVQVEQQQRMRTWNRDFGTAGRAAQVN